MAHRYPKPTFAFPTHAARVASATTQKQSKMKKITLLGITILSASLGVFASDYAPADAANTEIMACQYKAAMQFDDATSSVNSLAPIIADWCQKESDQFYRIMRSQVNGPIDERAARQAIREKDLQMASRVLLTKRANDRKNAQNTSNERKEDPGQATEWTRVGNDSYANSYMNLKAARKTSSGISVWGRVELKEPLRLPSGHRVSLIVQLVEYDCQNGRYRYLATNSYEDHGGKTPVSLDSSQSDWKYSIPDSANESESKRACTLRL